MARSEGLDVAVHYRADHGRVDQQCRVTPCYLSRLRHIGVGRTHARLTVRFPLATRHVCGFRADRSLLRDLVLDPARNYQPLGTLRAA